MKINNLRDRNPTPTPMAENGMCPHFQTSNLKLKLAHFFMGDALPCYFKTLSNVPRFQKLE